MNIALGASNTGWAKLTETDEMKVFIENQNNYMPDEKKMFARKLCVRLRHVHCPHDQDQQGQHKDVSRRSRNGPSRQCCWENQAADRKDVEKQKAPDIEVAAEELEEGNGQKEEA